MFHEGKQLGEYTLIELLGRGGFGEVWLAEKNDEPFSRFALKLPYKNQVDWRQITQEIGLWTLCGRHENLLPLIGARNFDGQVAIISEFCPDGSLEDMLRGRNSLPVEEAVELTIGVLKGIQHLHKNGIIHRDLKPANILLDGRTPRLTDFGISRLISGESLSDTISGTWAYMAPECFDGKRNVQTDIWSVGVILYQLLSGSLPFPQKEQTALIGSIMINEPEPLPNDLPRVLRQVVARMLAKNPFDRPPIEPLLFDLTSFTSQHKARTVEAMEELEALAKIEFLDKIVRDMTSEHKGENIVKLNPKSGELIRRALAIVEDTPMDSQGIFGALFMKPQNASDIIEVVDEIANIGEKQDVDVKPIRELKKNLEKAAKHNGAVIVTVFDDAIPALRARERSWLAAEEQRIEASEVGSKRTAAEKVMRAMSEVPGLDVKNVGEITPETKAAMVEAFKRAQLANAALKGVKQPDKLD